ncbi:hypothetical protein KQY27_03145 [Methanobrevibacter sp. TMH8]|uniref:hypothetical protein n=1 Tax=Methanobrevibacter sp. TMH8 TaxID=2848611 RepID=UPI001CCE4507|nr:hypothetical protein [Methanobrevibacter sp. TMH8]MBZ9570541.1 hypothetical protein [Methanobrevibacter sp. TMH8]
MNPIKKGNLLVILTIAIIAFGTSTVVASVTDGNTIFKMLNITGNNGTTELIAVGDGNFTPLTANQAIIQVQNVTNVTNNTTNTSNNSNGNVNNRTNNLNFNNN